VVAVVVMAIRRGGGVFPFGLTNSVIEKNAAGFAAFFLFFALTMRAHGDIIHVDNLKKFGYFVKCRPGCIGRRKATGLNSQIG
jgi:hypothetical protein